MRIYLAARYSRFEEMQDVAKHLKAAGHEIVSRWIYGEHDWDGIDLERAAFLAKEDLYDLIKAEMVISFTEEQRTATRGGRHVEFGVALAKGMHLVIVGPREHVFHSLPKVRRYTTTEELLTAMLKRRAEDLLTRNPDTAHVLFSNEQPASAIKGR